MIKIIQLKDVDEAFKYYNIDNKYKDRCYKCIDNINSNESFICSFNKINNILNYSDFISIKELWKYENLNEMFCKGIDPFVTNLIILLSFNTSQKNIEKYNLDDEQIEINKKRIKECFESDLIKRNYESVRISQMIWAFYFARVRIIEIGRLQYELLETNNDNSIIRIHIPGDKKLDYNKVIDSINLSKIKLKEIYKLNNMIYTCNSWLLSNRLNELINKNSNIHKFYELFDVVDRENCIDDILNFVYQKEKIDNYNELQENTKLQQLIKNELIKGTIFKLGSGILKK